MGCGVPRLPHVDLQLCHHAVMSSTISHMGYRESSRKEQSRPDHRTQDDNGNDGRRKECLQPRGASPTHRCSPPLDLLSPCLSSPPVLHLERSHPMPVSFSALPSQLSRMFPGASTVPWEIQVHPFGSRQGARRGAPGELGQASFPHPMEFWAPLEPSTRPHLVGANCMVAEVS